MTEHEAAQLPRWGDKPIKRLIDGSYDHRGHRFPVCGCPCIACYCAYIGLGVSDLGPGPGWRPNERRQVVIDDAPPKP